MFSGCFGKHIIMRKIATSAVIAVFLITHVLADAGAVVDAGKAPYDVYEEMMVGRFASLNVDTFAIPAHLGEVKYLFKGDSDKVIVHIQDAHCNSFAQYKISAIIDYLNKEYGVGVINLEGGVGNYDLSIFTDISGEDIRREVADYFVEKGEVNGAEFYAINNPDRVMLWGIEDKDLYMSNLKVYRDSLKYKPEVDEYLGELSHILNNLKRHIYTPELLKLDMQYSAYKAGNLDFQDYLTFLIDKAKGSGISIKGYPNLYLLDQAMELEEKIDFKRADTERSVLVDEMKDKLSKEEMRELIGKTVGFKTKRITKEEFYNYLLGKARELWIDVSRFPALSNYIVYVSLFDAVDRSRVMDELDSLEDRIKKTEYKNDTQRELNTLSKNLAILRNIFDITLTRTDYFYYLDNKSSFDVSGYLAFIRREAPKYRLPDTVSAGVEKLDSYLSEIIRFYEYSFKRDDAFLENLVFDDARGGKRNAMVMTGGFHTENLCELLRKQGISYVSILPKFTSEKDYESPYFQLLAGQTTDVQQFLRSALAQASSAAAMMQVASMNSKELAEAVWGRSSVEAYRDEIALRTILEEWAGLHGPQGAQVTVTQDGKELFTVSKGSNPSANRITFDIAQLEGVADRLNRTVNDEIIDPKIRVAMEAGSFETLTDENEAVKAAVEFFRVQAKAKGIAGTPAARELNKVADALEALAKEGKVSLLTGVTGFSGHAGGRGIYINKAAVTDIASLTGLIIHEAVAGFSHLHSISHIAEQLYLKAKDVTSESLAKIGEKGNMRELAVWDVRVSPEERWVGGRDIAAAGKAEPPQVLVAEGETNAIAGKMETYFMVDGKKGTIAPMGAKVVREMLEAGLDLPYVYYETADGQKGVIIGWTLGVQHHHLVAKVPENAAYIEGTIASTGSSRENGVFVTGDMDLTPKWRNLDRDFMVMDFLGVLKNAGVMREEFVYVSGDEKGKGIIIIDIITGKPIVFTPPGFTGEHQGHSDVVRELNRQMYLDAVDLINYDKSRADRPLPSRFLKTINDSLPKDEKIYTVDSDENLVILRDEDFLRRVAGSRYEQEHLYDPGTQRMYNLDFGQARRNFESGSPDTTVLTTQFADNEEYEMFAMAHPDLHRKLLEFIRDRLKGDVTMVSRKRKRSGELDRLSDVPMLDDDVMLVDIDDPRARHEYRATLGNKGANLGDMKRLFGDDVPDGFIITTNMYREWERNLNRLTDDMKQKILTKIRNLISQGKLSSEGGKLDVSVRSGASVTMPGLLDTKTDIRTMDDILKAIQAVFESWATKKAYDYREQHNIPHELDMAIIIQQMVHGDKNDDSFTAVVFSRDPNTGKEGLFGEWLQRAKGEELVGGSRTPLSLEVFREKHPELYKEIERKVKRARDYYGYDQDIELTIVDGKVYVLQARGLVFSSPAKVGLLQEDVSEGRLTESEAFEEASTLMGKVLTALSYLDNPNESDKAAQGKGSSPGAVVGRAVFPVKVISKVDGKLITDIKATLDKINEMKAKGEKVIYVAEETASEEYILIEAADGVMTLKGGTTSHAAVNARALDKTAVVGISTLFFRGSGDERVLIGSITGRPIREGDILSISGNTGLVYAGAQERGGIELTEEGYPISMAEIMEIVQRAEGLRQDRERVLEDKPVVVVSSEMAGTMLADDRDMPEIKVIGIGGRTREQIIAEATRKRRAPARRSSGFVSVSVEGSIEGVRKEFQAIIDGLERDRERKRGSRIRGAKSRERVPFVISQTGTGEMFVKFGTYHSVLRTAAVGNVVAEGNILFGSGIIEFFARGYRKGEVGSRDLIAKKERQKIEAAKVFRDRLERDDYIGALLDGFTLHLAEGRDEEFQYKPLSRSAITGNISSGLDNEKVDRDGKTEEERWRDNSRVDEENVNQPVKDSVQEEAKKLLEEKWTDTEGIEGIESVVRRILGERLKERRVPEAEAKAEIDSTIRGIKEKLEAMATPEEERTDEQKELVLGWMMTRVEMDENGKEKFMLGTLSALAVDFLGYLQGVVRRPEMLRKAGASEEDIKRSEELSQHTIQEYILHEVLEGYIHGETAHHDIIAITTDVFNLGAVIAARAPGESEDPAFTVADAIERGEYGRTPLGALLREFINIGLSAAATSNGLRKCRQSEDLNIVLAMVSEDTMYDDGSKVKPFSKKMARHTGKEYSVNSQLVLCTPETLEDKMEYAMTLISKSKNPARARVTFVVATDSENSEEFENDKNTEFNGLKDRFEGKFGEVGDTQGHAAGIVPVAFDPARPTHRFDIVQMMGLGTVMGEYSRAERDMILQKQSRTDPALESLGRSVVNIFVNMTDNGSDIIRESFTNDDGTVDTKKFMKAFTMGMRLMKLKKINFETMRDHMNSMAFILESV